jgi:uncharacterized membrane protein YgcG
MKTIKKLALVIFFLVFVTTVAYSQNYPRAISYVSDFAHLLSDEENSSLNQELTNFEKKTSVEIAVVIVNSLDNQSIEQYTVGLASEWKVGKQGKNNGIVFLVAPKEHLMRIQTASGVSTNLADKIRDEKNLPYFKSGNMPQGIIEGTHAIIRVFDPSFMPAAKETSDTQPTQWSVEDTTALKYILGGLIVAIILLFLIVPPARRTMARKYVLANSGGILATKFNEAEKLTRNSDVKDLTRKKFKELNAQFSSINQLTIDSTRIDWLKVREELDSMDYLLSSIVSIMRAEIAFAKKAREEGPELMKDIPAMISEAEQKLALGKSSKEAETYLNRARTKYELAQTQYLGMSVVDWVILYNLLDDSQSQITQAQRAHINLNHPSYNTSSSSSGSSSSYSPPEQFGGGSGFESNTGTTGTW